MIVFMGLVTYCVVIALVTGDIGFEGDDWWIFGWSYWNSFPYSLLVYARESLRPVEGVYWLSAFELFGFNKTAFHLLSLFLLAGAALLMGLSLFKAFPQRTTTAVAAALFAFFLPTVSSLTYVMTTDNSRLALLLFWASALAFQVWAEKSCTWPALIIPVALYEMAFLTYEAPSFLIFVVPLLVAPIVATGRSRIPPKPLAIRLAFGVMGSFVLAVGTRFLFLSGGAVGHRGLLPSWDLVWGYPALLPFYLWAPVSHLARDPLAWVVGAGVTGWAAWALLAAGRTEHREFGRHEPWYEGGTAYLVALGISTLVLGMLPYQMAGYGSVAPTLKDAVLLKWGLLPHGDSTWFNFNWSSRIFSAGSFGVAILFAALTGMWKMPVARRVAAMTAALVIGLYAAFHSSLIADWQEASRTRARLCTDLVSQVPAVLPHTNFLFVDLDSRFGKAVVFRGWIGLKALLRMLYDDPTLDAWYVYPYGWKWPNFVYQQGFVTPEGFVSRGLKMDEPVPPETLLILKRSGQHLPLLPSLEASDSLTQTGVCWTDASRLTSNIRRIKRRLGDVGTARRARLNQSLRREICGGAPPSRLAR